MNELDDVDRAILNELQRDGRISNVELARRINLSPPATHTRVKRLEDEGYIRQYVALLDREKLGYDMLCMISISLQVHQYEAVERFRSVVRDMPEVLEVHHLTGQFDYVLKVVVHDRRELERFVMDKLTPIPGIAQIYTSMVFSEVKSTTALPIE